MTGRRPQIGDSSHRGCICESRIRSLLLILLLAPLATTVPSLAQHQRPHQKEQLKRQVEKLEETWRAAQLNGDVDAMDRLLSDDYVGITMNGQVVTKIQQLDRMRARTLALTKIDLDDVKVKLIGQTAVETAVVTSRAEVEGTNDGESLHGTYRYTRVYARMPNGSWKITNFEATRVGEAAEFTRRVRTEGSSSPADGNTSPETRKLLAGSASAAP